VETIAVNNFGDTRSGGLAGPMGLLVIVLLSIATVLLIRNMNKRLRRLPDSFSQTEQTQREAEFEASDAEPKLPGVGPLPGKVDRNRSAVAVAGGETEVKGSITEGDDAPADGDQRRV